MKIEHPVPIICSHESSIINAEISSRLHRINFQRIAEIDLLSHQILISLQGEKSKQFVDFSHLRKSVKAHPELTERTRQSADKHLESIEEIYDEPELWVQSFKITAFRYLIASRMEFRAKSLLEMSNSQKELLLVDQQREVACERTLRKKLKRLCNGQVKEDSSTLSEEQQNHEYHILALIEDLGLSEHRNDALPLHDDQQLLMQLMVQRPKVFIDSAPYFNDNEIISIEAINRGYCIIDHVADPLRNCPAILSAHFQKRAKTARFCKQYYISNLNISSNDLDEIYAHLKLKKVQEDVGEIMALIADVTCLEDLCSIQEIAEGCFDYEKETEDRYNVQLQYSIHLRMLLNDILKKDEVLTHIKNFLAPGGQHKEQRNLFKRARRILQSFC